MNISISGLVFAALFACINLLSLMILTKLTASNDNTEEFKLLSQTEKNNLYKVREKIVFALKVGTILMAFTGYYVGSTVFPNLFR